MRGPGGLPGGERTEGGAQGWPGSRAALPHLASAALFPLAKLLVVWEAPSSDPCMGSAFLRSVSHSCQLSRQEGVGCGKAGAAVSWSERSVLAESPPLSP